MKKDQALVREVNDHTVLYDFSTFGIYKRIRMAVYIITRGKFTVTGKEKNRGEFL